MKTQTQLCVEALTKISAVGSGQSASAEDIAIAQTALVAMFKNLSSRHVIDIVLTSDTEAEEIPEEVFLELADYLGLLIQHHFGAPRATRQEKIEARAEIISTVAERPTYETLAAEYY